MGRGMPVAEKVADRDAAALSTLLQEAMTCGFLLVFYTGKAQLGLMEVIDTTVPTKELRGVPVWQAC